MKVNTTELTVAALDWVVAKCENKDYVPEYSVNGIGMEFEKQNTHVIGRNLVVLLNVKTLVLSA